MGKPVHGWFTGWLNLIGLIAVTASVDYGCATFLNLSLAALFPGWDGTLNQAFMLFVIILALHGLINIFGHDIINVLQNVSVWWHVVGVAAVVVILIVVPDRAPVDELRLHGDVQQFGLQRREHSGIPFWFYVLPLGFLLTQYTITGFDACAHVSEETKGAARGRRQRPLAVHLLVRDRRLDPAARVPVRGDRRRRDQRRGRLLRRDLRVGPHAVLLQDGHHHLHDRPVLLRDELRDEHVAHDVRVQPRPGDAGLAAVVQGGPQRHAGQRHHRRHDPRRTAHAAGALQLQRHPDRVLRRRVGHRHRAVPRVPHPDPAAAADGRPLRARPVDAREEVQADRLDRLDRDHHHLHLLHHADRAGRRAVERRLHVVGGQLRPHRGRWRACCWSPSGGCCRPGSGSPDRFATSTSRRRRRSGLAADG